MTHALLILTRYKNQRNNKLNQPRYPSVIIERIRSSYITLFESLSPSQTFVKKYTLIYNNICTPQKISREIVDALKKTFNFFILTIIKHKISLLLYDSIPITPKIINDCIPLIYSSFLFTCSPGTIAAEATNNTWYLCP